MQDEIISKTIDCIRLIDHFTKRYNLDDNDALKEVIIMFMQAYLIRNMNQDKSVSEFMLKKWVDDTIETLEEFKEVMAEENVESTNT